MVRDNSVKSWSTTPCTPSKCMLFTDSSNNDRDNRVLHVCKNCWSTEGIAQWKYTFFSDTKGTIATTWSDEQGQSGVISDHSTISCNSQKQMKLNTLTRLAWIAISSGQNQSRLQAVRCDRANLTISDRTCPHVISKLLQLQLQFPFFWKFLEVDRLADYTVIVQVCTRSHECAIWLIAYWPPPLIWSV